MKRLLHRISKFFKESWEAMGEAAIASNMEMEGYTDLEIELELNRFRKPKEKVNVQDADKSE